MNVKDFLPIPELEKCKSLLCIQPHPDDNEVGAGATIAKLARSGCKITYLTVTDGSKGTDDPKLAGARLAEIRKNEAEAAGRLLGASEFKFLNFEDGSYPDEKELCMAIVSVIREVKPGLVLTVDPFLPYEVHPDHRRIGMAAAEACILNPLAYNNAEAIGDKQPWRVEGIVFHTTAYPNTFVNVDDTWEDKIKAILSHKSQFDPQSFGMYNMYFDYKAQQYAAGRGYKRAEAFKVLAPAYLHMSVDTINL
jgi:LmbE family N-acetylglucosaminyl deacetylase